MTFGFRADSEAEPQHVSCPLVTHLVVPRTVQDLAHTKRTYEVILPRFTGGMSVRFHDTRSNLIELLAATSTTFVHI